MIRSEALKTALLLLIHILTHHTSHGAAGPIDKHQEAIIKPPSMMRIPDVVEGRYVFGGTNAPDAGVHDSNFINRRDAVCDSEANRGCYRRCISLKQTCLCGSNGKTYRNQCEMSCMRKVEMSTINWSHFGECKSPCPIDEQKRYKKMVIDFMMTRYLRKKVRRCRNLANCSQAKLVMEYTEGGQSILECPDYISSFLLFTEIKCPGSNVVKPKTGQIFLDTLLGAISSIGQSYTALQLEKVLDNQTVLDCSSLKVVENKLFNDRNCARQRKGLSEKELIIWAFDDLDEDKDWQLTEKELNKLSVVPDAACRETFFSRCDTNKDGLVRGDEWSACLGCSDCYKPCHVYSLQRKKNDRKRRLVTSVITCNEDGTCAGKQCEYNYGNHLQCWCVDEDCNEIKGSRSYSTTTCD